LFGRQRPFLRKYDVGEPAIAAAFAKKLAPLISNLLVVMRADGSVRPRSRLTWSAMTLP